MTGTRPLDRRMQDEANRVCGRLRSTTTHFRIVERHKWGELRITLRGLLNVAEEIVGR